MTRQILGKCSLSLAIMIFSEHLEEDRKYIITADISMILICSIAEKHLFLSNIVRTMTCNALIGNPIGYGMPKYFWYTLRRSSNQAAAAQKHCPTSTKYENVHTSPHQKQMNRLSSVYLAKN